MAAEQRTETSSNANGISYSTAQIDSLLNSFEAGDIITRSAVQTLLDYYADIRDHTHTVNDLARSKTFGNTGESSSADDTVDPATGFGLGTINGTPSDPGVGSTVTASYHNTLRSAANSLRTHFHEWFDDDS